MSPEIQSAVDKVVVASYQLIFTVRYQLLNLADTASEVRKCRYICIF